jgi:hypothetical protein
VNLIQFEILINEQVPFGVFFSALISSASEDGVRSSGDVAKAKLPVTQLHIPQDLNATLHSCEKLNVFYLKY